MTTRVLHAGGSTALRDADDHATWQHAATLEDSVGALADRIGQPGTVKVFLAQAFFLSRFGLWPSGIVVPRRPYAESAASWMARTGRQVMPAEVALGTYARLLDSYASAEVPVLEVAFHDLIDAPHDTSARIADFLAPYAVLDVAAMAAIPDPALRHYGAPEASRPR